MFIFISYVAYDIKDQALGALHQQKIFYSISQKHVPIQWTAILKKCLSSSFRRKPESSLGWIRIVSKALDSGFHRSDGFL